MTFINKLLTTLPYQAKFSMDELIPVLEKKISLIKGEDYVIDFFIKNIEGSNDLEVSYLAFPKQEKYVKAIFSYNKYTYKHTKIDSKHEKFERLVPYDFITNSNEDKEMFIQENDKVFLLAKEVIPSKDAFSYLIKPHEEDYLLHKNFFCYGEELDEISDTITAFAKKKLPKK